MENKFFNNNPTPTETTNKGTTEEKKAEKEKLKEKEAGKKETVSQKIKRLKEENERLKEKISVSNETMAEITKGLIEDNIEEIHKLEEKQKEEKEKRKAKKSGMKSGKEQEKEEESENPPDGGLYLRPDPVDQVCEYYKTKKGSIAPNEAVALSELAAVFRAVDIKAAIDHMMQNTPRPNTGYLKKVLAGWFSEKKIRKVY